MSYTSFRKLVWDFYKRRGRHGLPWRKTRDPYKILVSEVMLQQTQVERVIPFYKSFVKRFPTARRLAAAPLSEILKVWLGLGYNCRAKQLWLAARAVGHGVMPKRIEELEKLPGVGPSTARAVAAFAYNAEVVFVETNIRTAICHHFYADKKKVSDREIELVLGRLRRGDSGEPREWYWALMDYGAYLKKSGVRLNAKSGRSAKRTKFTGSDREARGAILKALAKGRRRESSLERLLGAARRAQLHAALLALELEGLVQRHGRLFGLPDFSDT